MTDVQSICLMVIILASFAFFAFVVWIDSRSPKLTQIGQAYSVFGSCFTETAVSASTIGLRISPQASISAELAVYSPDDQRAVLPKERGFCSLRPDHLLVFYHKRGDLGMEIGIIYNPRREPRGHGASPTKTPQYPPKGGRPPQKRGQP
jgi:hypothetical protein